MLRAILAILFAAMVAYGAIVTVQHGNGWSLVIIGAIGLISVFLEGRYRGARVERTNTWQPTGEKFIDPGTGKPVEVDYDPATGERNYREP